MPRTEKYFIGPELLGDIRRVVERIGAEPYRVTNIQQGPRLQEMPRGGGVFRMCTFTGAWAANSFKTVTFRNSTATMRAYNVFGLINANCGGSPVAVAKAGTAWYVIAANCS